MDFSELQRRLDAGGLQPVYVIQGAESFLKGEALRLIREKASGGEQGRQAGKESRAPSGGEGYDTTELDAAEMEPRKLFEDLRTPSLFAPRRLVVVDHAELLAERAFDLLLEYAEKPPPGTVLALVQGEARKKRRPGEKKPEKARRAPTAAEKQRLARKIAVVDCPIVKESVLPGWCVERARVQGKRMDGNAAKLLVETVGTSLGQLDGQVRSLAAFCRERQRITEKDVLALVGGDRARQFWDLTNAVTERNAAQALRALNRLLRDGGSPGWLAERIGMEFGRLIRLKELCDRRLTVEEISQRMGMHPYVTNKLLPAVRRVSAEELKAGLRLALEADVDCKTGAGRDSWILERLVLKLCGGR